MWAGGGRGRGTENIMEGAGKLEGAIQVTKSNTARARGNWASGKEQSGSRARVVGICGLLRVRRHSLLPSLSRRLRSKYEVLRITEYGGLFIYLLVEQGSCPEQGTERIALETGATLRNTQYYGVYYSMRYGLVPDQRRLILIIRGR